MIKVYKNYYTSNNDLNNIISCQIVLQNSLISRKSSKKFDYLITENLSSLIKRN